MKSSALTLGLGIVAAASSVVIGASAEAATLLFHGFNLNGSQFEFDFIPPTDGAFKSQLFVTQSTPSTVVQTLFVEPNSNDGSVTPSGIVGSGSWAATSGLYIIGWGTKGLAEGSSIPVGYNSVYSNSVYPPSNTPHFRLTGSSPSSDGWYTFTIEDIINGGDRDHNDAKFRVRAVPVPVPAVVPGIALAAAFFGSKALKRNKKETSATIA
ncbi:hypothetical protein [Pseudanabaena mucicola]|uniref:PTPA-CTERM sorting domain-containing protein n=1 Tax=Pseudanabaena mucicola FACHB-723 TaxID=2692860 RepID=A0ABR7ZRZ2_9CYAN|nr:hypothetical protein [Pseudanabaena mucicola]MBD2186535.1 hypothetical protein [Pseudanabaena mucicola FACHB-723]